MATSSDPRDLAHWSEVASASASTPHSWLISADQLRRAADVLRDQWMRDLDGLRTVASRGVLQHSPPWQMPPFVAPSMMMLLALSLENLAKGLMVARNPQLPPFGATPGPTLENVYKSHLSVNLLTKKFGSGTDIGAGVSLTPDERGQVERLRRFLLWGGRYPVPTSAMQMHHVLPDGPPLLVSTDDLAVIDSLLDRVRAELDTEALQWSVARNAAALADEARLWAETLAALAGFAQQVNDGVTVYVDASAMEEPRHLIVCCGGCRKSFEVSPRFPGAICPCGNFSYLETHWDPTIKDDRTSTRTLSAQTRPTASGTAAASL